MNRHARIPLVEPPRRILVVRLGALGDVIRTLPAVQLLRATWPEAEIAWAVESHVVALLEGVPSIDRTIVFDRDLSLEDWESYRVDRALARVRAFTRELRAFDPDLSLDFQGLFKSGYFAWASQARVRVAFERPYVRELSHLFANERVVLADPDRHRVLRAVALARAAGARVPARIPLPDLGLTQAERARARDAFVRLTGDRRTVAIAPFTSGPRSWKRYPLERWRTIAARLDREGWSVLVLAGPGEELEARALAVSAGPNVAACFGLGLRGVPALLELCSLFIGGDTGPMHMAWAVGTPVVALYGPTDPLLNAPFGEGHVQLAPERRTGRGDADKFPGITPERVLESAFAILSTRETRAAPPGERASPTVVAPPPA